MDENSFRQIASEYARQYGEELRRELNTIEQNNASQITPSLDRRVRREIAVLRRKRYTRQAGLIAACLVLVLLTPFALRYYQGSIKSTEPAHSGPTEPGAISSAPAPSYEIISLAFTLPDRFTVEDVEQDVEKTVYYLSDSALDDVVMTLERPGAAPDFDGLTVLSIGGRAAYGSSDVGYSLLAFEDGDILYVLTCRHDINTLVRIGESVLL